MTETSSDSRTCHSCGRGVAVDDTYCPRCGTGLRDVAAPAPIAAAASAMPDGPDQLEEQLRAALSPSFLLVRKLGEGGMASVYLAREPALRRLVAVKVLAPDLASNAHARARFEREAQAVAGLSHPNVLGIYGLGELGDGTPYFVMQYVGGKSLAARLEEEGPLDPDAARRITGEVAAALAAAHAKGIVHRDIKPANILYDDEAGRALVADFGIAAVREGSGDEGKAATKLTGTGMAVGTPHYMSPEQMLAEPVTEKTDVYALGLLGYELVAGHGPFAGTTPQELIAAHLRDVPRPLAEVRKDVDPEFAGLVRSCLEKDPQRRPTAADMAKRLAPGAGIPLEWPPPGLDPLHGRFRRWSTRFWVGNLLAVAIATLGFIAFGTRLQAVNQSLSTLVLVLAAAAGTILLVSAFVALVRPIRRGAAAVRQGYTWLTVVEALADTRGDTGALIAGSREYAPLDARVRSTLRLNRVIREGLVLASSIAPLFLLVVLLRLGSAIALPVAATPWLLLGPSAAAILAAVALGNVEGRAVGAMRRSLARRRQRDDFGRLVEPWYVSFESVRSGQALGRGRTGGPRLAWAGVGVAALGIGALFVLWPLWVLAALGPQLWELDAPKISAMRWKLGISERMRRFALAPDPAITPLAAGEAFVVLAHGSWASAGSAGPPRRPVSRSLPPLPELHDDSLFPLSNGWPGPNEMQILELATHGFSPAQRRWLQALAAHPAWREFSLVARAPSMDQVGAQFVLPFPESVTPEAFFGAKVPAFSGTKRMAYANAARAALYLEQGRRDQAEAVLRETVSFGFQLVDHGSSMNDELVGIVMVGMGRYNLTQFYTLTGRREGGALQALTDSLRYQPEAFGVGADVSAGEPKPGRSTWLAALRDTTLPVPLRRELLVAAQIAPCTNLRELIFGPGQDIDSAFAEAPRTMARFASDSAVIRLYERQARLGPPEGVAAQVGRKLGPARLLLLFRAPQVLGRLVGNSRVAGCSELALTLSGPRQ